MVIRAGGLISVADFPEPTAWTSTGLVAGAGLTLSSLQYMVDMLGNVSWRGEIYGTAPAGNALILTFPASIAPQSRWIDTITGIGSTAAATVATVFGGTYGTATVALNQIGFRNMVAGAWPTTSAVGLSLAGLHWSTK